MAASPFVSEEVLHAFVDGETDAQTNAVILAYLSTSPVEAARVETWRSQNELIRSNFAKIEHEPIPMSLSVARNLRTDPLIQLVPTTAATRLAAFADTPHSKKTVNLFKLCAAIVIAFAGGMIAALVTPQITRPVADLFQDPTPKVRNTADVTLPSRALEIAALRESDPASLKIKDDAQAQFPRDDASFTQELIRQLATLELSVTGLRIGIAPKDPALCLFLTNKARQPLTLCRDLAAANEAQTLERESAAFQVTYASPAEPLPSHSLRAVDWRETTERFVLAGRLPDSAMLDLSHRLHEQIEAANQKR